MANTILQQRFIGERARALAFVLLTRRAEVAVSERKVDGGIDLLVTLHPEDKHGLRQFAVQVKGVWRKSTADDAKAVLRPGMGELLRHGPYPFPVVLFFFTMENSQGWYTWVTEPVVTGDGGFELRSHEDASCHLLDGRAIDEIVDRVDRWYEAFFARTDIAVPRRRK